MAKVKKFSGKSKKNVFTDLNQKGKHSIQKNVEIERARQQIKDKRAEKVTTIKNFQQFQKDVEKLNEKFNFVEDYPEILITQKIANFRMTNLLRIVYFFNYQNLSKFYKQKKNPNDFIMMIEDVLKNNTNI